MSSWFCVGVISAMLALFFLVIGQFIHYQRKSPEKKKEDVSITPADVVVTLLLMVVVGFLFSLTAESTTFPLEGGETALTQLATTNVDDQVMLLDSRGKVYLVNPEQVVSWKTTEVEPGYYSRGFKWSYVKPPEPLRIVGGRRAGREGKEKVLLAITERNTVVAKRPTIVRVENFLGSGAVLAHPDQFLWVPAPAEPGAGLSVRERIDKGRAIPIIETGD